MKLLWLLLLVACTTTPPGTDSPPPFQGSGVEQFFLTELPSWANGSISANCSRNFSIKFLEVSNLMRLHGLTFVQAVELQTQFNRKWLEDYDKNVRSLTPQEEGRMLLESMERVKGGSRELSYVQNGPPQIIWWDSVKDVPNFKSWVEELAQKSGTVVLMSFCSSAPEIESWVEKKGMGAYGTMALGAESLMAFNSAGSPIHGTAMPLDAFFNKSASVIWVKDRLPSELPVGFVVKKIGE